MTPSAKRFAALTWMVWLCGCAATVSCPEMGEDPRPVFLLDHGRHATLVLGRADGRLVRYSYGDWRYYAEADTRLRQGVAALLWRTPAALGRRELDAAPTQPELRRALRVGVEEILELEAAGAAVDALLRNLDATFFDARAHLHYNALYDLEFVPHPRAYWFWYNSNHMVADWLRGLGCAVRGGTLLSNWRSEAF
jgi:hypothetical protein